MAVERLSDGRRRGGKIFGASIFPPRVVFCRSSSAEQKLNTAEQKKNARFETLHIRLSLHFMERKNKLVGPNLKQKYRNHAMRGFENNKHHAKCKHIITHTQ